MRGIQFVLRWESFWSMCLGLTAVSNRSEEVGNIEPLNIIPYSYCGCGISRNLNEDFKDFSGQK